LNTIATFLKPGRTSYSAADVVKSLLSLSEADEGVVEPVAGQEPVLAMEPVLATA